MQSCLSKGGAISVGYPLLHSLYLAEVSVSHGLDQKVVESPVGPTLRTTREADTPNATHPRLFRIA